MANNSKHPKTDRADLTRRVWVIEGKFKVDDKWFMCEVRPDTLQEYNVVCTCENKARRNTEFDYRYRAATLTFDDDGQRCVIY